MRRWTAASASAMAVLAAVVVAGCGGKWGLTGDSRAGENRAGESCVGESQHFAEIVPCGETDYSVYRAPGLETLPFVQERFAILDGTVYYIVPNEQQVGEETAGGTAPGTAAGTAPGTAAGTAPGTVPGTAAICASRMDGSGAREIAGDLADPEEAQILIGNGWLVYGFENGDFRGLASVNLKDQTRRQLAVKYRDGLRLLGIDGDSLYIRQMGEVSGQGRDEQGNFFSESAPIQEVIRYDLGTTESQDVVSFSGEDSADGVRGLTVADGILYYWQREAQGRFRFCSLKDKTYVNYPVFGDSGPYAVSEGRVYFADDGAVFSYPLGTEEDWGHVEEIYGNRVFRPEKAGEPKQLAVLPDEAGVIAGLTVSPRGIYVKAQQEGAERTLLYRIPEEDGEPVELLADDEP